MLLRLCAPLLLLACLALGVYGDEQPVYKDGPVVCKGTKPLLFHSDYDKYLKEIKQKKQFLEAYWDQLYNHLIGCEIIVGNLIIPHQLELPFEIGRINKAIKDIKIVTGFIYIYDVQANLNFENLLMVYGNELFKYPNEWSCKATDANCNKEYAIFVDKFDGDYLYMPNLRYIKNGLIGFNSTPNACLWKPHESEKIARLNFREFFDNASLTNINDLVRVFDPDVSFSKCPTFNASADCKDCNKCAAKTSDGADVCQPRTRKGCSKGCSSSAFCLALNEKTGSAWCCPKKCWGGCIEGIDKHGLGGKCFYCEDGLFLDWSDKVCKEECRGKTIAGTQICLPGAQTCPDYMFSYNNDKTCGYECPPGMEFDPIQNFADDLNDKERLDPLFVQYWPGKNTCKPCRMTYDSELDDFKDDCGIGCVLPLNSLSFFTILNIYPAITEIKDYDFKSFQDLVKLEGDDYKNNPVFKKKCRHIYGSIQVDQFSVGYPYDNARLTPDSMGMLTYATGLYGNIRVENTEGYWFADLFRNLLVIEKPIDGLLEQKRSVVEGKKPPPEYVPVKVRYNSDLRTLDLQRLLFIREGTITVKYNPLYIPPRDDNIFTHIKQGISGKPVEEVSNNGLTITRVGQKITYDGGCERGLAYYYERCVKCADPNKPIRSFEDFNKEYFAECQPSCDTSNGFYELDRDGEKQCLKCNSVCKETCSDQTPFTCKKSGQTDLACKDRKIDITNMLACASSDCPGGFYSSSTDGCKKCEKACRVCYGEGDEFVFPGQSSKAKGCKGCGLVYLQMDRNGKPTNRVFCADVGSVPRCDSGGDCGYFSENPVFDTWFEAKASP